MNLQDLDAFLAVAETGSVGAAGRRLHLTQPAVTRRIQNLERQLAATLLYRDSKPLRLTSAGETVVIAGRQVRCAVEELRAALTGDGEPVGLLRLGLAQAIGDLALGAPIGALRRAYPRLTLTLHSGWTQTLLKQLAVGALDAAALLLAAGTEPPPELSGVAVSFEQICIAAARDVVLPETVRLRDLAGHPWVVNPEGCGYRRAIGRALQRQGLPFAVAVDIVGAELQLSAVAEGAGLGLVPARVLAQSRWREQVRALTVADFHFDVTVWVVARPHIGRLDAPVRQFGEVLRDALEGLGDRSEVQDPGPGIGPITAGSGLTPMPGQK